MATDKIRPCTAAELLAYHFAAGKDLAIPPVIETTEQQMFVDERQPAEEFLAEELRAEAQPSFSPSNVEDDLSEADYESPTYSYDPGSASSSSGVAVQPAPPAPLPSASPAPQPLTPLPSRLSAEELRAPGEKRVPDDEGSLAAHWKRNKVSGKGVEMLESMAFLFDDDVEDSDRVGFLQVRLMAPKARKTSMDEDTGSSHSIATLATSRSAWNRSIDQTLVSLLRWVLGVWPAIFRVRNGSATSCAISSAS